MTMNTSNLFSSACKRMALGLLGARFLLDNVARISRVNDDALAPSLANGDLVLVLAAQKYYTNDWVMYRHPNTGERRTGRLVEIYSRNSNLPMGHCRIAIGHSMIRMQTPAAGHKPLQVAREPTFITVDSHWATRRVHCVCSIPP
ncbi:hypothetical protein BdWA1_001458 [Babesia duncani]|uniref:Uncharacterized protein n=1 Tax=Babesia duncani TaxID=323732 RepID=A0AAD9UQT3_9APIC|nr:hypothetical protein BdWA1_001458 [Babesia duncani]